MVTKFNNMDEFDHYWYSKTNLFPHMAETQNHLNFVVNDKKKRYKCFYDKRSGKHIGFEKMHYNTDFFDASPSGWFSYNDYFIGIAPVTDLIEMKKKRNESGKPFSKAVSSMIDSLKEDDNDLLVLFKIKEL
jgi:hypothetical protein